MPILFGSSVYIHMPKTGGIWVAQVLRARGGIKIPGLHRHATAEEVQRLYPDHTLVGSIRDPWSWYVSFWNHLGSGSDGPPLRSALTLGDGTFEAYLYTMTHSEKWSKIPEALLAGWPWPTPTHEGFYASLVDHCYGNPYRVKHLLDTRHLNTGLAKLIGVAPFETPPQNTGHIRPGAVKGSIWTPGLVRDVLGADGEASIPLGYTHPGAEVEAVSTPRR